jgi:hypothetical protein
MTCGVPELQCFPMDDNKKPLMLSLIIPGQESVTGDNMDMYLEPLLEEL